VVWRYSKAACGGGGLGGSDEAAIGARGDPEISNEVADGSPSVSVRSGGNIKPALSMSLFFAPSGLVAQTLGFLGVREFSRVLETSRKTNYRQTAGCSPAAPAG
jgi:hypothetical protein